MAVAVVVAVVVRRHQLPVPRQRQLRTPAGRAVLVLELVLVVRQLVPMPLTTLPR